MSRRARPLPDRRVRAMDKDGIITIAVLAGSAAVALLGLLMFGAADPASKQQGIIGALCLAITVYALCALKRGKGGR